MEDLKFKSKRSVKNAYKKLFLRIAQMGKKFGGLTVEQVDQLYQEHSEIVFCDMTLQLDELKKHAH